MWRTVIVNRGEKITIRNRWLVVYGDQREQKVPVDDLYAVVLENGASLVSVNVLSTLAQAGAHVYCCDDRHLPVAVSLPLNTYHKPLSILKRQLELPDVMKDGLWEKIVRQKIKNQALCLKYRGVASETVQAVMGLAEDTRPGDVSNREAVAARKYFRALFGSTFKRSDDGDITNAALNYGYSILRSSVGKTVVAHGYTGVVGLHHINESNPLNLADDLMEPLRPLVDLWTDAHCEELWETLNKTNRRDLISLVNMPVKMDGKKMRVRYALDVYVKSLTSAIMKNDVELLRLPTLLQLDEFFEDDLDG